MTTCQSDIIRDAMNQVEFDEKYGFQQPKNESFVKTRIRELTKPYYEPFTSLGMFQKFIFGLVPILHWLPNYKFKENLMSDIIGGLTVGVLQIPQGIAYALLAHQSPISGLYTSLIPPLVYMFFWTSRHTSVGTSPINSLMAGIVVDRICEIDQSVTPQEVACAITFAMGIILFIMGFLRLHFFTSYLSVQLIIGFTVGSAVHVLASQIKTLLGIRGLAKNTGPFYLFRDLRDVIFSIPQANPVCCTVSFVTIVILYCGKEFLNPFVKRKFKTNIPIPWELIVVILSTLCVYITRLDVTAELVVVQSIPTGLPSLSLPNFSLILRVLPDAISISLVGISTFLSMSKIIAKQKEYEIDAGQEFFASSFTSIVSSIFPTVPFSCSMSRTLVAVGSGVATQFSIVFSSLVVLAAVSFLGQLLQTLPLCVLSSIIYVALYSMFFKFGELKELWRKSKIDFSIWIVAFLSTVLIDVSFGLLISILFALFTTILREQYAKWTNMSSVRGTNDFQDSGKYVDNVNIEGICIFRFDAPLLFHNVECFKKSIEKSYQEWHKSQGMSSILENKTGENSNQVDLPIMHLVIDCSGITAIDLMGVNALKEIFFDMKKRNTNVYFSNAKVEVRNFLEKCNFYDSVSKDNFYPTLMDATLIARNRISSRNDDQLNDTSSTT